MTHIKPSKKDVIATLNREFGPFLAQSPYNPERFWGQAADAVLALLPGKTEQEVREQVMAEILVAVETFEAETKRANASGSGLSAAIAIQAGASLAINLKRIARGGDQS